MNFKSNLEAPDLSQYFKLLVSNPPWGFGHDVYSDPDFDPNCAFWTLDEVSILYNVAKQIKGTWVDIGARTGWTTAYLLAAGCSVVAIEPEFCRTSFLDRFRSNVSSAAASVGEVADMSVYRFPDKAAHFFDHRGQRHFNGFIIDGDHDAPQPSLDAAGALASSEHDTVLLFHDFLGKPIRDAVTWLIGEHGFKNRTYWTPNIVELCWRGCPGFEPPEHVPDFRVHRELSAMLEREVANDAKTPVPDPQ